MSLQWNENNNSCGKDTMYTIKSYGDRFELVARDLRTDEPVFFLEGQSIDCLKAYAGIAEGELSPVEGLLLDWNNGSYEGKAAFYAIGCTLDNKIQLAIMEVNTDDIISLIPVESMAQADHLAAVNEGLLNHVS